MPVRTRTSQSISGLCKKKERRRNSIAKALDRADSPRPSAGRRNPGCGVFDVNKDRFGLRAEDSYAVLGALSHSLTLYAVLEALHVGADLHFLNGLSPKVQISALQERQISVLYATPSQLRLLQEGMQAIYTKLPDMRLILSGGGKLDATCRANIGSLCPNAEIVEFYGATETSFITLSDYDTPDGSVGIPYPGVSLKILDDHGRPTQGVGEIWIKSPYLFEGYEIGESRDTRWNGEYLTVGEMGFVDADGNLFLKGRKSRMVTVADQNVFLEDIEAVLQTDKDVQLCAALAKPDDKTRPRCDGLCQG